MKNNKKLNFDIKNLTRRFGNISLLITVGLFILLFVAGIFIYRFNAATFFDLLNTNAYLIVVAIGETFVLLIGCIDISVGSTVAFTCMLSAFMLRAGISPAAVIPTVLLLGIGLGWLMGFLIQNYNLQPFIVTLAGMFFLRGMCAVIGTEAINVTNDFYKFMTLGKFFGVYYYEIIALLVIAAAFFILRFTKFGRSVYAVGGNAQSALLMGLPVNRIKITVYAISGFCAALGGVIYSFYKLGGDALQNIGMELDAISSAVIGGTLLTGGVGSVIGTTFGVLIQGIIKTIVTYQNLNSWWTKLVNAALLCMFIVIQRIISARTEKAKHK